MDMKLKNMRIRAIIKSEMILIISFALAVFSGFLIPPDIKYMEYIDIRTIVILFSLMVVTLGLQDVGLFSYIGNKLLEHIKTKKGIVIALVSLCFFSGMLITNDVALIMFVPFALFIIKKLEIESDICTIITLMTIAANLGSMLTPIGNPQNLYLYNISGLTIKMFMVKMLPYAMISAFLIILSIVFVFRKKEVFNYKSENIIKVDTKRLILYLAMFLLCILSVAKLLDIKFLFIIVIISSLLDNKRNLLKVDYSLLLTFICFFIFIGNMGRYTPFYNLIIKIISGYEELVAIGLSQIMSNVPTAILLSGFTDRYEMLMVGTNIGGLGTLIASMASIISYKQVAIKYPWLGRRYIATFTLWNIAFLIIFLIIILLR